MNRFLIFLLFPFFIFSNTPNNCSNYPNAPQTNSCDCLFECVCEKKPATTPPCQKGYNAPYRVSNCLGIVASASFIYWQTLEDNLDFGIIDSEQSTYPLHGKVIEFDFEYNPGFKLGVGYNFKHDYWQGFIEYTRLHQTIDKTASTSKGTIYPFWHNEEFSTVGFIQEASGSWQLSLDLLDLDLSRNYYVGLFLKFRPHLGLRVAWIDQTLKVSYIPFNTQSSLLSKNSSCSSGIGPKVGVDTFWTFCGGYRLFGNVSTALLFTDFHLFIEEFKLDNEQNNTKKPLHLKNKIHRLNTQTTLSLGIGWEDYIMFDRWHLDIALGYDFNAFFDQNVLSKFCDKSSKIFEDGNLYMQGLTLTFCFDY